MSNNKEHHSRETDNKKHTATHTITVTTKTTEKIGIKQNRTKYPITFYQPRGAVAAREFVAAKKAPLVHTPTHLHQPYVLAFGNTVSTYNLVFASGLCFVLPYSAVRLSAFHECYSIANAILGLAPTSYGQTT